MDPKPALRGALPGFVPFHAEDERSFRATMTEPIRHVSSVTPRARLHKNLSFLQSSISCALPSHSQIFSTRQFFDTHCPFVLARTTGDIGIACAVVARWGGRPQLSSDAVCFLACLAHCAFHGVKLSRRIDVSLQTRTQMTRVQTF